MDAVFAVHTATLNFPKRETYSLVQQLNRAAVSIPSNIAEGQGRNSGKEFQYFLGNAKGSLHEVETQVLIATKLGYIPAEQSRDLLEKLDQVSCSMVY